MCSIGPSPGAQGARVHMWMTPAPGASRSRPEAHVWAASPLTPAAPSTAHELRQSRCRGPRSRNHSKRIGQTGADIAWPVKHRSPAFRRGRMSSFPPLCRSTDLRSVTRPGLDHDRPVRGALDKGRGQDLAGLSPGERARQEFLLRASMASPKSPLRRIAIQQNDGLVAQADRAHPSQHDDPVVLAHYALDIEGARAPVWLEKVGRRPRLAIAQRYRCPGGLAHYEELAQHDLHLWEQDMHEHDLRWASLPHCLQPSDSPLPALGVRLHPGERSANANVPASPVRVSISVPTDTHAEPRR